MRVSGPSPSQAGRQFPIHAGHTEALGRISKPAIRSTRRRAPPLRATTPNHLISSKRCGGGTWGMGLCCDGSCSWTRPRRRSALTLRRLIRQDGVSPTAQPSPKANTFPTAAGTTVGSPKAATSAFTARQPVQCAGMM